MYKITLAHLVLVLVCWAPKPAFGLSHAQTKSDLTACIEEYKARVCTRDKGLPCLDQVCGKLSCLACGALAQLVHHNTNL